MRRTRQAVGRQGGARKEEAKECTEIVRYAWTNSPNNAHNPDVVPEVSNDTMPLGPIVN